jgi:hypothetical protein
MNVGYVDFWPGFDVNCNWFNLVFKHCFPQTNFIFSNDGKNADIILASSFGNARYYNTNSSTIKIFYTGENERPDFVFADYALSFDYDDYSGRNFRLPHWYLYVNWWNEPNFPHARISVEQLKRKWNVDEVYNRQQFCSIIIGNPVRNRIEVAQKLSEYIPVHAFGRAFGKYYDACKVKLLEKYRWNICFENSIYPGYITEKLLEAKVAGCIPIYYGDSSVNNDFNSNGFINYKDFKTSDELFNFILSIEKNEKLFGDYVETPIFNTEPSLDKLYEFLRRVVENK